MLSIQNTSDIIIAKETVGKLVTIHNRTLEELIDEYERLLAGVFSVKYSDYADPDLVIKYTNKCLEWIRSTDFYRAPASTRYHESVVGGLLVHTLQVYNNIIALHHARQFESITDIYSATLVALVHDWCKIDYYEAYEKNVKNESTNQWEKQIAFRVNQRGIPLGHGVTSMFLAEKFFRLTSEEALAIRWHMSRFRVCDDEINEMQQANEKCPLVHLLQFADQLAITEYASSIC